MPEPHDIPDLDPAAIDAVMTDVRNYADLLKLARALASHITTDAPDGCEARRSFQYGKIIYVIRESNPGVAGALCRLCAWLDEHRPQIVEPEIDEYSTKPVDTSGNR